MVLLKSFSCPREIFDEASVGTYNVGDLPTNTDDCCQLLLDFVKPLGVARPHTKDPNSLTWHVKPTPTSINPDGVPKPKSHTADEFSLHTDEAWVEAPATHIAMLCIHPDMQGGGTSTFLSVEVLKAQLGPTIVETLNQPWYYFRVPHEFQKPDDSYEPVPIINGEFIRYRQDVIEVARDVLSPEDAATAAHAFHVLQTTIGSGKGVVKMDATAGSVILFDNRRFLHGRESIKDRDRHYVRVRFDAFGHHPFARV